MTTTVPPSVASRVLTGTAFGVFMMTMFGGVWLAWGLLNLRADSPWLIAALALAAIALLIPCFGMFQIGHRAGKQAPLTSEQKQVQRKMGRTFGIIFAAEGVGILVAVNVLNNLRLESYVLSAIAAIVGLHFLPLARLYRFSLYYVVGAVIVLDSLISLALASPMREIAVGLSMGAILWLTCGAVLRRGFLAGAPPAGSTNLKRELSAKDEALS